MKFTYQRTVQPYSITATIELDEADIIAAFVNQPDPNENLFYDVFSPAFDAQPLHQKLGLILAVLSTAESSEKEPIVINLRASKPEPK